MRVDRFLETIEDFIYGNPCKKRKNVKINKKYQKVELVSVFPDAETYRVAKEVMYQEDK